MFQRNAQGELTATMYVAQTIKSVRALYSDCEVEQIDLHPHGLPIVTSIYVHFTRPVWEQKPNPEWAWGDEDSPEYLADKTRPPRRIEHFNLGGLYSPDPDRMVNDNRQCPDSTCFCKTLYRQDLGDAGAIAWERDGVAYWDWYSYREEHRGRKQAGELPLYASGDPVEGYSLGNRTISGYEIARKTVRGFYRVLDTIGRCPECQGALCGACGDCHASVFDFTDCDRDTGNFGKDCYTVFDALRKFNLFAVGNTQA